MPTPPLNSGAHERDGGGRSIGVACRTPCQLPNSLSTSGNRSARLQPRARDIGSRGTNPSHKAPCVLRSPITSDARRRATDARRRATECRQGAQVLRPSRCPHRVLHQPRLSEPAKLFAASTIRSPAQIVTDAIGGQGSRRWPGGPVAACAASRPVQRDAQESQLQPVIGPTAIVHRGPGDNPARRHPLRPVAAAVRRPISPLRSPTGRGACPATFRRAGARLTIRCHSGSRTGTFLPYSISSYRVRRGMGALISR